MSSCINFDIIYSVIKEKLSEYTTAFFIPLTDMIKLRYAVLKDLDYIVDFQQRMALETEGLQLNTNILAEGVKAVIRDELKGRYLLAISGTKPVAMLLTTYEWSDWRNGTVIWIQSLFVENEFRKKGIFKKMYQYLQEQVLSDAGLKGIRLYVDRSNTKAIETYISIGMNGDHYQTFEWMKA